VKWATYRTGLDDHRDRVGVVIDGMIHGLDGVTSLQQLLGDDGTRLGSAADYAQRAPCDVSPLTEVRLLPPIPQPRSIRDYSAFEDHYRAGLEAIGLKFDPSWYDAPSFYFSNNNVVVGTGVDVRFPAASKEMDYELEVAAVVGREGVNLTLEEAQSCIAGYTIFNDWSARDLLRTDLRRSLLGPSKGKDSNNGLGPLFVTPAELESRRQGHGYDLEMTASVNGRRYSRGNWSGIHWSFAQLLAHASRDSRIVPGDIIASGTVGTGCIMELSARHGSEEYPYLEDGDEVVLSVEGLGELRNRVYRGFVGNQRT
jgi:2-keto-4-pentenoate hydratase/2-oxohepta-3-ene-1,7-dioic acid hydratase in catechol pathway